MKHTILFARTIFFLFGSVISISNAFSQAYFEGNVRDASSKENLKNVRIMVVNNRDTSFFNVDEKGAYNIATREGRNKIFAIGEGFVTELNSIDAAKGSKNKVDISMVKTKSVDASYEKRAAYKMSHPAAAPAAAGASMDASYSVGDASTFKWSFADGVGPSSRRPGFEVGKQGRAYAAGLTAGEINDFGKWNLWNDLGEGEFSTYNQSWNFFATQRYCVQLMNQNGTPIVDAKVVFKAGTKVIWESHTDNTGKAELWNHMFGDSFVSKFIYSMSIEAYGRTETFSDPKPFVQSGVNFYKMSGPCAMSDQVDIAFVVDATGSMGDEINYLKQDLDTLIHDISRNNANVNLRMGSVFYRDNGDEYVTRVSPFSTNTSIADNFILDQVANGGGDFPEGVDTAMYTAINTLDWSSTARARILFLLLDAPPHNDKATVDKIQRYTALAAAKGIRIVPVACSGADKVTEFLMRSMALATNGKYVFLTNHSGIGGNHIDPSTDFFKVETLFEVLSRTVKEYCIVPQCSNELPLTSINSMDSIRRTQNPNGNNDTIVADLYKDSVIRKRDSLSYTSADTSKRVRDSLAALRERKPVLGLVKFYPNPTTGILHVIVNEDIKEIYVADIGGKLLQRHECKKGDHLELQLGQYSAGIYYLKYATPKGWLAERIVLRY